MRFSVYVLISSALTLSAQTMPGSTANLYSREKEAAVGAQIAQQVRQTATPVDNAAALAYVQQMGAKLAAQFPEPSFPFTFALVAGSTQQEPVVLPGGYIFVPANLFLTAQDDSEFAGMLAHAMAHAAARHATRAASQSANPGPLVFLSSIVGGAPTFTIPASFVRFTPAFEQEADRLAVNVVSAAGYDPQGLIRYLSRERANTDRIAALQAAMQNLPHPASPDFLQIQGQLKN
jgi:beta-barrel assembly-enhancing protease